MSLEDEKLSKLIPLSKFPTIPAPWSSSDDGESWIWGDYVIILQKKPILLGQLLQGKSSNSMGALMSYPFAMTVFYKKSVCDSSRPILIYTIEKSIAGKFAGFFSATGRGTLDSANLNMNDKESVIKFFFNLMRKELFLDDEPLKIGKMNDVHGHPETGFPVKKSVKTRNNPGCLSVVILIVAVFIFSLLV